MIHCTTQGIQLIFYNNYKWSITFKNCESLYCTLVIYIILYINYTSKKTTQEKTKTTLRCYFYPSDSQKFRISIKSFVGRDVEKQEPLRIAGGTIACVFIWRAIWQDFVKLRNLYLQTQLFYSWVYFPEKFSHRCTGASRS